jgi:multiple sugar transport system ATP-binding protein
LQGKVDLVEALGAETLVYINNPEGAQIVARQNTRTLVKVGDEVGVAIDTASAHLFDAKGRIAHTGSIAAGA